MSSGYHARPRMGFSVALLVAVVLVAGCDSCGSTPGGRDPGSGGSAETEPSRSPTAPDKRLPGDARRLAERLTAVTRALDSSIDAWLAHDPGARRPPPPTVTLEALYQQRVYRLLARRPRLAARAFRHMPGWLAPAARDITAALRELGRLTPPTRRRRFRTGPALPAGVLRAYYRRAQQRFRVAWHVLAAINFVESAFGRLKNDSAAGAQGPMQFLPPTWREYGLGGDVHDPRDAILGAANYLRRSAAPRNYRRALFAYNPSRLYVRAVLRYARRMARSRRAYYAFHSWQVFVRTPGGDRRLTGPGIARLP
jgi:hypothetical protein